MHIYCAGPMRGKPDFNFPAFEAATAQLRKLGHEVFNPAERDLTAGFKSLGMTGHEDLSDQGFDLRAALNADLEYITLTADALCVLSGWENSAGARAEVATAHALGLPVVLDGGFLYAWAGKYPYRNNCVVKPELAPSGKLAPVTNIGDKLKLTQTAPGYQSINIDPADVSNTFTGIMQDKLDEKKSRHDHPAGKRRTDSDDAVEYARYPLINPDDWHDPLPISAEQRLGFDPNAELFRGLSEENTAELRRKLAEPEHPEVKAVRDALAGETRTTSSTGGEKGMKLAQVSALDANSIKLIAEVAGFGAKKYSKLNFMKGYDWSLSYDAMQRHLMAFWSGEDKDPESGMYHLAHAGWHALALLSFIERGLGTDDRYTSTEISQLQTRNPHATT